MHLLKNCSVWRKQKFGSFYADMHGVEDAVESIRNLSWFRGHHRIKVIRRGAWFGSSLLIIKVVIDS